MAIAPTPMSRYGSAAELAAVAGVSVKTVRRQIAAGALPSVKLGRRRLIPLDALERRLAAACPEPRREAPMSAAPTVPALPPTVDARGKLIPLTPEQQRQRNALALAALDDIEQMGDETEQRETLAALIQALNAERAAVGARPVFAPGA